MSAEFLILFFIVSFFFGYLLWFLFRCVFDRFGGLSFSLFLPIGLRSSYPRSTVTRTGRTSIDWGVRFVPVVFVVVCL